MNPLNVFHAQVDAFNDHDVEAFLSTYANDATVTSTSADPLRGHDSMRTHYTSRLSKHELRCEVLAVYEFGDRWVVAHELVSDGSISTEVVATFEIAGGLILRSSLVLGSRSI